MLSPRTLAALVGPALLVAAAGCDSGPKVVPVNGTLTYKSKPVANAVINFLPERGRQSWAQTDAEGHFKINYDAEQDGAVVGKHKVWIDYRPNSQSEQEAEMVGKAPPISADLKAFFAKYNHQNSKLVVEITKDTKDLKLDLD